VRIDTRRLRLEDYICLIGCLILLASIFLPWYSFYLGHVSGWDATRLCIIPMVAALIGILITLITAFGIDLMEEYAFVLTIVGIAALVVVIVRIYVRPAGLSLSYGIILALLGALSLILAGITKLLRTHVIF
jgi:peptidoglycan/LPS O-acetylase OafA/YrhL